MRHVQAPAVQDFVLHCCQGLRNCLPKRAFLEAVGIGTTVEREKCCLPATLLYVVLKCCPLPAYLSTKREMVAVFVVCFGRKVQPSTAKLSTEKCL